MEELNDTYVGAESPEEEIDHAAKVISEYLSTQDKRTRVLFMRRYYMGDSISDAAKYVGISENNANVKLYRVRAKLKKKLMEEGIDV